MDSVIVVSSDVNIFYKKNFQISDGENISEEPHLILSLIYNINGERLDFISESRYRFVECNPSSLHAFIMEKEPLPLDTMVDSQDAEITRETISGIVNSLVNECIGVEGLIFLKVNITIEINQEEEDLDWVDLEDNEFLRERRMSLLQKIDYMGTIMANEKEVCAICLEEMRVGQEVACTPCIHRFHHACIGRWFETKGLCPICRFKI